MGRPLFLRQTHSSEGTLMKSTAQLVLPSSGIRSLLHLIILSASAVALPAVMHLTGAPVRWLLPMHWPVLLASMIYGWRGGLVVGMISPLANHMITGYPMPAVLAAMTFELGCYGFFGGFLREVMGWPVRRAMITAIIIGRTVFILWILAVGAYAADFVNYLVAAVAPGLMAALFQIWIIPNLSKLIIEKEREVRPRV